MRGSKYPDKDRARALGIAVVEGVQAAAEATGIPERTVYSWTETPEFAELRERTKEQVADEWWAIVQAGFRRVAHLLVDTNDLQKAAVATAIVADKMLLIRGEATSRSESRDLTKVYDDHELSTLRDFIDKLDGPAGTVGDEGVQTGTEAAAGAEVRQPSAESVL